MIKFYAEFSETALDQDAPRERLPRPTIALRPTGAEKGNSPLIKVQSVTGTAMMTDGIPRTLEYLYAMLGNGGVFISVLSQ